MILEDKNYLKNFAYVWVKIGCMDLDMVPKSRVGEIKKGFFEFQYTREVVDVVPNNGNEVGNTVAVQGEVDQQGTPKKQRINNNEAGSQSAPPRVLLRLQRIHNF
jgi:hypothetical protein